MDKLNKCPFCGSHDLNIDRLKGGMNPQKYGYKVLHFIRCDGCGAIVSFRANEDREHTIAMWNGREPFNENEKKRYEEGVERWQNVPKEMR